MLFFKGLGIRWRYWSRHVGFHGSWCWVKDHTFWPHNVVKIQTLPVSWCDVTEKIIHANFQLLCDFMEKENPKQVMWNDDIERLAVWEEIQYLYRWWKERKSEREKIGKELQSRLEQTPDQGKHKFGPTDKKDMSVMLPVSPEAAKIYDEWRKWDDAWDAEDTDHCIRLIKIRQYLWV